MTPSRYIVARIAQSFGITRRNKRMSDAAFETHLLREAEQILGEGIWEATEEVDHVSVEYWNVRKLQRERHELEEKVAAAEAILVDAHEERSKLLNQSTDAQQELEKKHGELTAKLEVIARERDQIVNMAKEIRHRYDGIKTKLSVLAEEGAETNTAEISKAKEQMREMRSEFQTLKEKRDTIGKRLEEGDAVLREVENRLGNRRQVRRDEASKTFQIIGKANRDISNHRAQLGLIETREQQLYGEIGSYVSRNIRNEPALAEIHRDNQQLIDLMTALRRSIIMNRKLTSVFD